MIDSADIQNIIDIENEHFVNIITEILNNITIKIHPTIIFFHGSYTRKTNDKYSDIDIILAYNKMNEVKTIINSINNIMHKNFSTFTSNYTEKYSWFGRLWTFYIHELQLSSIDIGIITINELKKFYVEPDAAILLDSNNMAETRRHECFINEMNKKNNLLKNLEFEIFHTTKKLKKSLTNGHLWDAFEYVNILRRNYFKLVRFEIDPKDHIHVGRPERNIERDIPITYNIELNDTIPEYDIVDITISSINILNRIKKLCNTLFPEKDINLIIHSIDLLNDT